MEIEAHDPHHQIEADLQDKGLSHNRSDCSAAPYWAFHRWRLRMP